MRLGFSVSDTGIGIAPEAQERIFSGFTQAEATIIRSEKAAVGRSVLDMARQHPNPDFWTVDTPPTERVIDSRTGLVTNRVKPNYKALDNVFTVKEAGVEHFVTFNEDNPRAVQFARTLKNMDAANMGPVLEAIGKATRYLAQWVTSRNPLFWMTNFARDVQGVAFNLQSTPLKGQAPLVMANIPAALGGFARLNAGKKTGRWTTLAQEFKDAGGQTGYMDQYRDSVERMDQIVKEVGRLQQSNIDPRKIGRAVLDVLEAANDTIENGVRLAVYAQAREEGISQAQAASIAKNISVNFNRKGQVAQHAGMLYAFFNASMQGTSRIAQTLFSIQGNDIKTVRLSKAGQKIVAGGILLGSLQALMLMAAGFGDDEPPEFVRERNTIIPIGNKKYITIPMPLGFAVLPNIGRIATEFVMGGFKDPVKHITKLLGIAADAFNPIGGNGTVLQMVTPTALDPLAAIAENKDWTKKPIAKVAYDKTTPGHKLWKDTASTPSKLIAEAINTMSGGSNYVAGSLSPTPDQIDSVQVGARPCAWAAFTSITAASP